MTATLTTRDLADLTIGEARRILAAQLREAGFDTPDLDARIMLEHVLELDHAALASAGGHGLDEHAALRLQHAAMRRLRGEPVALITGVKEFWGLRLSVTAATLIPRPETETVVETALRMAGEGAERLRPLRVLDLGTGSGAILLALISELPGARGLGVDRSLAALAVAAENARRLGLSDRTALVAGDFASALSGRFDLVVSNPPYIATSEIESLPPGVRDFEPRGALDGGQDGLAAYRMIAADIYRILLPGGHLVVEIGQGQQAAVREIFHGAGLGWKETSPDLAGIPRALAFAAR